MEIIGRFKVRTLSKDEKVIKVPPGVWGEYILELHEDGSFVYRPAEGQLLSSPARYQVWDPTNVVDMISFQDEKKALEYKERMERKYGRVFRLKKIFKSAGCGSITEEG